MVSATKHAKQKSAAMLAAEQATRVPVRLLILLAFVPIICMIMYVALHNPDLQTQLLVTAGVSAFGYFCTECTIPLTAPKLLPKLFGVDINKRGMGMPGDGEKVPESLGLVSGMVFLVCLVFLQLFYASNTEENRLVEYHVAMLSICFAILLGFADDVIDIKWRNKIVIGVVASLPLVISYSGATSIIIPHVLRPLLCTPTSAAAVASAAAGSGVNDIIQGAGGCALTPLGSLLDVFATVDSAALGGIIELGHFYKVYMIMLIVFCTNSVNIYAGINGLEAGQSVVVGWSVLLMNLYELSTRGHDVTRGNHLFSLSLMLPFVATTLGLLKHNWYPSKVFVGDIFPYYAGMTFAVSGILGHFSKSLVLLLIPQVLNFLYSCPQLFRFVPCPRHRLPRKEMDASNKPTGLLVPSKMGPDDPRDNYTLLCLSLRTFGAMHERTLCVLLMAFQVVCALCALVIRYSHLDEY